MRCDDWLLMIEEYVDGELNEQTTLQVNRHLAECRSCAVVLQTLSAEGELYALAKPEFGIRRSLWADISARLTHTTPFQQAGIIEQLRSGIRAKFAVPQVSGWVAAGLVVAAVGLTILVMRYASPKPQLTISLSGNDISVNSTPAPRAEPSLDVKPETAESVTERSVVKTAVPPRIRTEAIADAGSNKPRLPTPHNLGAKAPDRLVREAEQKYLTAISILSRPAARKRSRLDPETQAKLEQAILSIDNTIATTRRVVRQHPDDPIAVQYMLTAYARKVDLLRDIMGR